MSTGPSQAGPTPHENREPTEVSVGQLMGDIGNDLSTLMRQELDLAKAELRQEATEAGKSAAMLGGSGVAGYMTLLFLSIAAWAGLDNVMDSGLAAVIVAVVWAIAAAVLFVVGRNRMRQVHPVPERAVETAKTTPEALKPGTSR